MKVWEKIKGIFGKKGKRQPTNSSSHRMKLICMIAILVVNVAVVVVSTIAWFSTNSGESKIQMVSGDINVKIRKVSAYKYVYPYYPGSAEFVDYNSDGIIKKYTIEDHTIEYNSQNIDDITINSNSPTVISLDTQTRSYSTIANPSAEDLNSFTATNIHCPASSSFSYYLLGDKTFCGDDKQWSTTNGIAFSSNKEIDEDNSVTVSNVVVSAGSRFVLFDKTTASEGSVDYMTYGTNINNSNGPFKVLIEGGIGTNILCLKSGVYSFTYSLGALTITLQNKRDAIIDNNILDPTLISIDYAGSVNKTDPEAPDYFPSLYSYVPEAIFNQNTMVILDVELDYRNVNPILASLTIERNSTPLARSMFNLVDLNDPANSELESRYEDTRQNLIGYLPGSSEATNNLYASDFFSFYAVFTQTPFASAEALWGTELNPSLHRRTDYEVSSTKQFVKFKNGDVYDYSLPCPLHTKELDDSLIIQPSNDEDEDYDFYHCYICIDYDYEYTQYFLNENRLGKTYLLFRDFGFRFIGTQELES